MAGPNRPAAGSSRQRKVQPPRPPNAWILYRSSKFAVIRETSERLSQATVSKRVSDMWRKEPEHVKRHFERMADDRKAEHQQLYPDYRFSPQKKEEKAQAREDRKQSRRAKKAKAREATPAYTDADANVDVDANATAAIPPPLPMPYIPQPYHVPGYQPNMVMPHPFMFQYIPETYYGPGGPSPPMSAAPSPAPYGSSESPEMHPCPEENVASSSSSPATLLSPSSESQASSSSSRLPSNPLYLSSLPSSHQPSPNPYATQPLPTLLFQSSAPGELPLASPQVQFSPPENTVVQAATIFPTQLSRHHSQNLEEVVNFDIPINQTQNFTQFSQSLIDDPSLESLRGMLSRTNENGVFNLSNVDTSDLLTHPKGNLEVAVGPQASTVDYNGEHFADFDLAQFQQEMASFTESASNSAPVAAPSVREDLQALFRTPNNPNVHAYTTTQQRQPSVFTQDMMRFFNFEAAEDSIEDGSSTIFPASAPTTVAPQQVRVQSTQHAAAIPIFTQMTNTATVAPATSYVPPAGAIYSSMRRAGGSWKASFTNFSPQVEEPNQSWTLPTN